MIKQWQGGDYSEHNAGITTFKDDDYVILRVGYRGYGSGEIVKDAKFGDFVEIAKAENKPIAIYFYTGRNIVAEAFEEREFCVREREAAGVKPWRIFIDCEETKGRMSRLSAIGYKTIAMSFCNRVKEKGYKRGYYCSESWRSRFTPADDFADCLKWIAHWDVYPSVNHEVWQYTNNYTGYGSRVDRNIIGDEAIFNPQKIEVTPDIPAVPDGYVGDTILSDMLIAFIDICEYACKRLKELIK